MSKELLLKDCIENVKTFHEAFLIGNEEEPKAEIPEADYLLRYKLMREEKGGSSGRKMGRNKKGKAQLYMGGHA